MSTLAGRIALVTGSTSGIGMEIARALSAAGCRLVINGVDGRDAAAAAREAMIAAGAADVAPSDHDLLEAGSAGALVEMAQAAFGGLDILVNNAGIQHVAPVEAFAEEHWDRIIQLNLSAPFRLIRHALPVMRRGGWGRIVNIASVHGLVASVHKAAYIASKHGLVGLTKTVALETAAEPITCNAICPGFARTALLESVIATYAEGKGLSVDEAVPVFLREKQPSETFISPADIGALTVFLCSDAARQITGTTVPIDGGWTAQ